jgi:dTDP-4-dehydrorhamnose reductase
MKIAITGAGGLVGTALVRHLCAQHQVLAPKHDDLDITDRQAARQLILNARPDLVINCAVLSVDACEHDPNLAWAINVTGPEALAEVTAEVGAEFLHISTNYVFDGKREEHSFYTADDAPRPLNVYGKTKLEGERAVRAASPRSFIVRTSWVFGPGKESFFSTVHRRLMAGERLRAITDVWASATYVADFVARVEEILRQHYYATYHIVNYGVCSYYEFALEAAGILGMANSEVRQLIEAVSEVDMKWYAPRPRYTPLRCLVSEELGFKPVRDWRAALRGYINSA